MDQSQVCDPPPASASRPPDAATSEVGLPKTSPESSAGQNINNSQNNLNDQWKLLFEMQQSQMMELIRSIKEPNVDHSRLTLPEFNPDSRDSDARAWCNTVDLCMQEKQLSSSNLIITMSKALKGSAASWLAQHSFAGITWPQLKDLFLARFDYVETPAATLCRLFNESPKEGECLSSYASRFLSTLMSRWRSLSTEQIAIAVTLAHAAKVEPRLQRLAFTTEIDTRVKLQQELMALTYRKRGLPPQDRLTVPSEPKKPRLETSRRCYNCNKPGHVSSECFSKPARDSASYPRPQFSGNNASQIQASVVKDAASAPKKPASPTCYYCNEPGHIATRCPKKESSTREAPAERRVDVCTIKPATDHLLTETDDDEDLTHEDV